MKRWSLLVGIGMLRYGQSPVGRRGRSDRHAADFSKFQASQTDQRWIGKTIRHSEKQCR